MIRWSAVVDYRTNAGIVDVNHQIEELDELQEMIERGPDWRTIEKITITYIGLDQQLTVEQAEQM